MSKRCPCLVLAAAMAAVSVARADSPTPTDAAAVSTQQPVLLDDAAAAPARKPLMSLLNGVGLAQPLEKANINIYGFAEGSYSWNFAQPDSDTNFGRVFDFEHDEPLLNQLDLTVERTVDVSRKKFDVGGRMEWIYGADAGLIHSNGLFDWYNGRKPENQFDLNQAYLDFAVPVGNGLLVRAGKFVTLLGQETINPTGNALYSHSYLFGFAIPFTHTGILGTYAFNDEWSATAGITRGWEQSLEDNNAAIDFLGQVKWTASKNTTLILNVVSGPEQPEDSGDYRTVLDFIISHAVSDQLTVAANADFAFESNAAPSGDTAYWYGIAGYAGYKINDMFTLNGRAEWFRDEEGTRIGAAGNYYELTLGLAIKPFPKDNLGQNLLIRPELRGDYASEDVFNDGNDQSQFTAAVDVIFTY